VFSNGKEKESGKKDSEEGEEGSQEDRKKEGD
jgi:hypothetical protein